MSDGAPDNKKRSMSEDEAELFWKEYNRQLPRLRRKRPKGTRWKATTKVAILTGLFMMALPFIDPVSYSIFTKQLGFPRFLILELIVAAVIVLLAAAFDMARSSNRLQHIWQRRP
jgi:hypothetical protein